MQWIEFLAALPEPERTRRLPRGSADASGGFVELRERAAGSWEISLRPTSKLYRAAQGEQLEYSGRKKRPSQDWLRFPVAGISQEDAIAYLKWLDRTGRVTGARLCTEHEWERAARGADGREFPHGDKLLPDDANFDVTYGRKNSAYGPDAVGSHPGSASPFGLYDMAGNVWEMTTSSMEAGQLIGRGGSFYQFQPAQRSSNRYPMASVTRDHTVGFRVCSSSI
jgi:formylglycine-generating enzyme required for sulfatase activity